MKRISIADMTLTECGSALTFKEKIEIARHLDNLNVDVIDLPELENIKTDTLLVRTISAFVRNSTLSVCTGTTVQGVENAAAALSSAKKKRLKVELPVSTVQMEYSCHMKAAKMLETAKTLFKAAKEKCGDVEFFAADATRAEAAFLSEMISAAAEEGVTTVTLCDNEAAMLPDEFGAFLSTVLKNNPVLKNMNVGVLCENRNKMAAASEVMALKAGAQEVKCCAGANAIPDIDSLCSIIKNCGERIGISCGIKDTELHRITKQISWIAGTAAGAAKIEPAKQTSEEDEPLGAEDSEETVAAAVKKLGYDLSGDDMKKVYEEFIHVAKKKSVGMKELDAVVASAAMQVPQSYKLISYVSNSGNVISASAQIKLEKDGAELFGVSLGDGPVDASFRAIEQIIGRHFELDDFRIQAVTEGRDSVGSALIRLRSGGKLYSGNGISTDIIGACVRAYINAVNKIVYEEEN